MLVCLVAVRHAGAEPADRRGGAGRPARAEAALAHVRKAAAKWQAGIARCGTLYRARSRLYRNEILQVNTRWSWKALAEI